MSPTADLIIFIDVRSAKVNNNVHYKHNIHYQIHDFQRLRKSSLT